MLFSFSKPEAMCDKGTDKMSWWQLARITGPVLFFSIILPFIDNVTDLILIVRLYFGVHYCKNYCLSTFGLKTCDGFYQCREDVTSFCNQNNTGTTGTCQFRSYTTLATSLLCKTLKFVSCIHE